VGHFSRAPKVEADGIAFSAIKTVLYVEIEASAELVHYVLQDKTTLVEGRFQTMARVREKALARSDFQELSNLSTALAGVP